MTKRVSQKGQYDIRAAWTLRSRGYTIEQIAEELGRGRRTMSNYLSRSWLDDRGLLHLAMTEDEEQGYGEILVQIYGWMIQQHIQAKALLAAHGIVLRGPRSPWLR